MHFILCFHENVTLGFDPCTTPGDVEQHRIVVEMSKDLIHLAFKSAHWTMKTFVCPNERLICMCIDITITPCCDKGKLHIFINEHTHPNVAFFVSMLYYLLVMAYIMYLVH